MPNYFYWQGAEKNSPWRPAPVSHREQALKDSGAVFATALSVSKLVENMDANEKAALAYEGPFYLDWDSKDIKQAVLKVNQVIDKFEKMGVDCNSIAWYASGQKGFHAEVPQLTLMDKLPKGGVVGLPLIYKEIVFKLAVDTLDLTIYSQGQGRMWRIPNVQRPDNGKYKVPMTVQELRALAPTDEEMASFDAKELRELIQQRYDAIVVAPRELIPLSPASFNIDLHLMYAEAQQAIDDRLKARKTRKRDPNVKAKAQSSSVKLLMDGQGADPSKGFHAIAMQVAIAAVAAGMSQDEMLKACEGLCQNHESDSNRYNSYEKRQKELLRLHDYMADNPGYEFTVAAFKSILIHEAPDLDGLPVSEEDVRETIKQAETSKQDDAEREPDEYADVTAGVTMSRYGVYIETEFGKKRVCAVSFKDIHLLYSMDSGQLAAYEAAVTVNGKVVGRQTMELDTFQSLSTFNKFCLRYGHALQGLDQHVRGLMMRFVEEGKKRGKMLYIVKREGLDVVNIPNHDNPALREPFMVYASGHGVLLDPRVRQHRVDITFQGFPDPRGNFKTDISDAPVLADWVEEEGNKQALVETLTNLFQMQAPDVIAKLLGWNVACFWRMLFHKGYSKFPLLHVNGAAGSGKTSQVNTLASFFYYNQEPKMLSPGSTYFAISEHVAGSASVPMLLDEYKPQDMGPVMHDKLRAMFRDAYNCKSLTKGGGNRDNDDYRVLHHTQLAAPIVFIAEAAEEEAAVAERVVLVTISKPSTSTSLRQLAHYTKVDRNKKHLAILGQYLATLVIEEWNVTKLQEAFDPIFAEARDRYMLTDKHDVTSMRPEEVMEKQAAKERSVFNYTVTKFGLLRFEEVLRDIYEAEFDELFGKAFEKLKDEAYGRMSDLRSVTQPEWAKVMTQLSDMSWSLDPDSPIALRPGKDYALVDMGGKTVMEISLRSCYLKYRTYAGQTRSRVMFPGDQAFLHAMRDCPALMPQGVGVGQILKQPNVFMLDVDALQKEGVTPFATGR